MMATTTLLLLAHFAVLGPLAIAYFAPNRLTLISVVYGAVILGMSVLQTGVFTRDLPDFPKRAVIDARQTSSTQCEEAIVLLEKGGVIVDRSSQPRILAYQPLWAQLPELAQDAIRQCLEQDGRTVELVTTSSKGPQAQ